MKKKKIKTQPIEDDFDVERDGHHYADALPKEAMLMSRCGVANGYDFLRFGERWNNEGLDRGIPIVQIDKDGVQLLVLSDKQREWIAENGIDEKRASLRRKICRAHNYAQWVDLTPHNHEFLLSLHWVPAEPYTAMEVIAIMARGDDE